MSSCLTSLRGCVDEWCFIAVIRIGYVTGWIATLLLYSFPASAAEEFVAFGLTNRAISGAKLSLDGHGSPELYVGDLADLGYKGLSVQLGQVQSGLFFVPSLREYPEDDNFMVGHAFGRVGGLNRRLSTVFCRRSEYATYPITIDFLPLGSLRKTVQVVHEGSVVHEESYTTGEIVVSTDNSDNITPRVNPFWRMPDGSVGVLLEFSSFPPITLPSGRIAHANCLFVRADDPLFKVDYVSRVDVYGGGGLPEFSALDERLGAFGRPHRALGDAIFEARATRLTMTNCRDSDEDGVMVDLEDVRTFRAGLRPVSLSTNGSIFRFSATSSHDEYNNWLRADFAGPIWVERHNGAILLGYDFSSIGDSDTRIQVLHDGNSMGELNVGTLGVLNLGTNELAIASAGVTGGEGTNFVTLFLKLSEPATVQSAGQILSGTEFRFSPVNPTNDIGTFSSFQMMASGVPFTITNEFAAGSLPLTLAIESNGTNVLVAFPGVAASSYSLVATDELTSRSGWSYLSWWRDSTAYRSRVVARVPNDRDSRFFRLEGFAPYVSSPAGPTD